MTALVRFKDGDLVAVQGSPAHARHVLLGEFAVREGFVPFWSEDGDEVWLDRSCVDRVLEEAAA